MAHIFPINFLFSLTQSHTEIIAKNIPNAKLSVISGDHFIANKRPEEFNKAVEDFLCDENNRHL